MSSHNRYEPEFISCVSAFFRRELISLPLIKRYPHLHLSQRCGLKVATLELDTSAHPSIEYIAGNRLSIYPVNPTDQVIAVLKHLKDDLSQLVESNLPSPARRPRSTSSHVEATSTDQKLASKQVGNTNDPLYKFVRLCGKTSLKMALTHLFDISNAPSRALLHLLAEYCTHNREQRQRLLATSKSDEAWERWVCSGLRTLRSTLDEFQIPVNSIPASKLLAELSNQQPRQYSISSIKSSKRFRTEILVFQHRFSKRQISLSLQNLREHENMLQSDSMVQHLNGSEASSSSGNRKKGGPERSIRSIRSVVGFGASPISSQQVARLSSFSGPLLSQFASATSTTGASLSHRSNNAQVSNQTTPGGRQTNHKEETLYSGSNSSGQNQFQGLCSNYLLSLSSNEQLICEFVENPRFTLKGNRERPIMMVGQDVGVVAFRSFWQQRTLEQDRAQVFYTLFKDLKPKKFGDMHMVCITGNKCRIEDVFKRELDSVLSNKVLSTLSNVHRSNLLALLDRAAMASSLSSQHHRSTMEKSILLEPKELQEFGSRIARLLVEHNGCLYTCCDPHITQAIELLVVESVAKYTDQTRTSIMNCLPKWKGRCSDQQSPLNNNQILYTLENPFEGAQIVQEIYDSSI